MISTMGIRQCQYPMDIGPGQKYTAKHSDGKDKKRRTQKREQLY